MYLYKCGECDLLTSENFFQCPKCKSQMGKKHIDIDKEEGVTYKLCMKDLEWFYDNYFTEEERVRIKEKFSDKEILEFIKDLLQIPSEDCVAALIRSKLDN